jgi:hypothetical protein
VDAALAGVDPVVLDRWDTAGEVDWRARAGALVAVHVPRRVPGPDRIGTPLEVTLVPARDSSYRAVGVLTTIDGQVSLLPSTGGASDLATAVEHLVWHPDLPVPLCGLRGSASSDALVDAIRAVLDTGVRTVPWRQLITLVGDHPDICFITDCPTRRARLRPFE